MREFPSAKKGSITQRISVNLRSSMALGTQIETTGENGNMKIPMVDDNKEEDQLSG